MLGEMMSRRGLMNPLLAMWTPNLLLGAAGVFFMVMTERR
jgi:lipopolysaccharide export LptBFGC system permease protein LptF